MGNEQHPAWQWLLDNQAAVDGVVRRSCRGAYYLVDELIEEVYDRVQRVYDTFEDSYGTPRTPYMLGSLKWYLWKWMNANYDRVGRDVQLSMLVKPGKWTRQGGSVTSRDGPATSDELSIFAVEDEVHERLVAIEEVQKVLNGVCEYDRRLLVMRHLVGMQLKDIAKLVGVTTQTACKDCFKAEEEARRVAGV